MSATKRKDSFFPELRSFFADFDGNSFFETPRWVKTWLPAVNISESDTGYEIEVAAPGVSKSDFDVAVNNGVLTISFEKKAEKEEKKNKGNYTLREFSYNSFRRSFTLPESVDDEKIGAKYEDGVLRLTLTKKTEAVNKKSKEISIS